MAEFPAPLAARPPVVEAKVIAATAGSTAVGIVIAVLAAVREDDALLGGLPTWLRVLLLLLVPPLLTFSAGYAAPHTPRTRPTLAAVPDDEPVDYDG